MKKFIGGILILFVALYSVVGFAVNDGFLISIDITQRGSKTSVVSSKPEVYVSAHSPIYTAIIRNSTINGVVIIGNESIVLIENVTFNDSATLIIEDDASVTLRDFRIMNYFRIYTFNSSNLKLYSGTIVSGSLTIYTYNYSTVNISSAFHGIDINCYDYSLVYINMNITNSHIHTHDYAMVYIDEAYVNSTSIVLYESSTVHMSYVDDGGLGCYIDVYDDAFLGIYYSNLSSTDVYLHDNSDLSSGNSSHKSICMYSNASIYAENAVIQSLYSSSNDEFFITNSDIFTLSTGIDEYYDSFDAGGYVLDSSVEYAYLYSAGITHFVNTNINQLYYCLIHNDTLMVNQTDTISTSNYSNYDTESSTVNYMYVQPRVIARGASSVTVNRTYSEVFLIDVASAYIFNARDVYVFNSNATIEGFEGSTLDLWAHSNSHVMVNSTTFSYLDVDVRSSSVDIYGMLANTSTYMYIYSANIYVEDSFFDYCKFYLRSSYVVMNNTILNDTYQISVANSTMHLYNSTLNTTYGHTVLYVDMSRVIFEDSTVSVMASTYFELEDGSYIMNKGIVGTTNIVSGVAILGRCDLTSFLNYFSMRLIDADLVLENYSAPPMGFWSIDISLIGNSNLTLRNVMFDDIYIYVENSSTVTLSNVSTIQDLYGGNITVQITDSELSQITPDRLMGTIHNATIEMISAMEIGLEIYESNVDEISAHEGFLIMDGSNASSISLGEFEYAILMGEFPNIVLLINNSIVKEIGTLGGGRIAVENSEIGNLYYALSSVDIKNSQVNFTLENFFINVAEDIVVDSNTIPTGKYESLLTVDASSTIGYKGYGIVTNISNLNLTVRNSEYVGILGLNAEFHIVNSELWVLILLQSPCISVRDTLINSTFSTEPPPVVLSGDNISFVNTDLLGTGLAIFRSGTTIVENVTSDLGMVAMNTTMITYNNISSPSGFGWFMNISFRMTDCNFLSGDLAFSLSEGSIENITADYFSVYNSTVTIDSMNMNRTSIGYSNVTMANSRLSEMMLDDEVNIVIWNSTITSIETYMLYYSVYPVSYSFAPENIYLNVYNSNISNAYVHHNIYNASGELEYSETLETPFDLKTRYENTNISKLSSAIIDIYDFTRANITGFLDVPISTLRIYGRIDRISPTITMLTDTPIEYEFGLTKQIEFSIFDDTPKEVWILLNSTEIFRGPYTAGEIISITISDNITSPGNYYVQIYADDRFENIASTDISVTVYPTEAPTIVSSPPSIINVTVGDEVNLSWTAEDRSPNIYRIYVNGSLNDSGTWTSGVPVEFSFVPTRAGKYNITIIFEDLLGLATSSTIIVNVEKKQPTFSPIIIALILLAIAVLIAAIYLLKRRKAE